MQSAIHFLVLAVVVCLTVRPAHAEITFDIAVVDSPITGDISLAFDSDERPHISYAKGGGLWYARLDQNDVWIRARVDSGLVGDKGTSIALDAQDNVSISYCVSPALKLARQTLGNWSIETVDTGITDVIYGFPALALSGAGAYPCIVYADIYDPGGDAVKYAEKPAASWSVETVQILPSGGGAPSLDLDANDQPHVAFYYSISGGGFQKASYATRNGGAWTRVEIDGNQSDLTTARAIPLSLDPSGDPHIAYSGGPVGPSVRSLRYGRRTGGAWVTEHVYNGQGDDGADASLALDSAGNPRIALDNGGTAVVYAAKTGSVWTFTTVDSGGGNFDGPKSVVLDSQGNPAIAYRRGFPVSELRYAVGTTATSVPHGAAPQGGARLLLNAPNPFTLATTIEYEMERQGSVRIGVYDATGRLVRRLVNDASLPAGQHTAAWDGRSDDGAALSAGVYFLRLDSEGRSHARPIHLLR